MRFTKAALGVAVILLLTFGFMPGQVYPNWVNMDCDPALIAALEGWGELSDTLTFRSGKEANDWFVDDTCGDRARSMLIKAGLIATGFVAAVAAAEYLIVPRKESTYEF